MAGGFVRRSSLGPAGHRAPAVRRRARAPAAPGAARPPSGRGRAVDEGPWTRGVRGP
ncbi:hypothetical protein SLNWT_6470 [Streptomyces albus]|uniref:Uncharacterized protein n=1 Tax=Streptomyces albus (strain ATCC 21838 / DSM 41398 / FERM P-419 / JCM 4703 / NBRC 107858) TaxID=1081613 RepID=A0A0B5F7Q2_STRA4|nr:hypothetical protein SLNWT_6470 [Streptomyces albus]AOU81150.1 hypothetical protein SLNHY_6459 [Streptomyces albus]AYN36847.1 hypothetical protein DUI70_6355 [Streptomyces albus]